MEANLELLEETIGYNVARREAIDDVANNYLALSHAGDNTTDQVVLSTSVRGTNRPAFRHALYRK